MPWSPWPYITRGDAQLAAGDPAAASASYRHAIVIDSSEWRAWLGLALASRGRARTHALARARVLYPTSSQIERAAARLKHTTNG
jgi:Tfp pilus assembly protein PilF